MGTADFQVKKESAGADRMKLRDLMKLLEAELIVGGEKLDLDVQKAFAADLMSDVLAFATEGSILLTGLTNAQVIRTAEMVDISAVLFVRGKRPQPEAVELAKASGIPLLSTPYILYETCGRLYQHGIVGSRVKARGENPQ
jgi:predicted transcriptional regulator